MRGQKLELRVVVSFSDDERSFNDVDDLWREDRAYIAGNVEDQVADIMNGTGIGCDVSVKVVRVVEQQG